MMMVETATLDSLWFVY